jgi:dolichol kinase
MAASGPPQALPEAGRGGLAAAAAACAALCAWAIARGLFAPSHLAAVLMVAALVFFASRSAGLTGLVAFPFLCVLSLLEPGFDVPGLLLSGSSLCGFALSVRAAVAGRVFVLDGRIEMKWWRVIARPFALLFIPIGLRFGRPALLFLLAGLAVVLIGMDLFRMLSRYQLRQLFKRKESKRFSSMTTFMVAVFVIFLVFPDSAAYLGLAFITIGDIFGKLIGIRFGRRALVRDRTLEGSLAFLAGSFMAGWVIYTILPVPLYAVISGPPFASAVELFSMDLDDNFTVGILTCAFLYALGYFLPA